ncbi:MAG: hypothetical protein Q8903_14260 [Bacteroidota bacterium]|nr:hypothetical protein [Bacteroidota bacterium]
MNNKLSLATILRFFGCLIFDVAVIIAFFNTFALFTVLMPEKSAFMLLFLLSGLALLNVACVCSHLIFDKVGIPYSASVIILFILYALISNVVSVLLIVGSIVTYIVWELILLALFVILLSIFVSFSKRASANIQNTKNEQTNKTFINLQLMKIETEINAMEIRNEAIDNSFYELRERMNASTPFGRVVNNPAVAEVESMIISNLQIVLASITSNLDEKALNSIQKMMENTRQLLVNREKLIVK